MAESLFTLLRHELTLYWRGRGRVVEALSFFVLLALMLAFASGVGVSSSSGYSIIYTLILLSNIMANSRSAQEDYENKRLHYLCLSSITSLDYVISKWLAHWCAYGLTFIAVSPLVMVLYGVRPETVSLAALACFFLGTLAASLLMVVVSLMAGGARRGALLAPVILLPFYVPLVIFGAGALGASGVENVKESWNHVALLLGYVMMLISVALWLGSRQFSWLTEEG